MRFHQAGRWLSARCHPDDTRNLQVSHLAARIAFMGKSFGDAFEIDLGTTLTRLLAASSSPR